MKLKLIRADIFEGDRGAKQILGWLYVYKNEELVGTFATLELPWKDNQTGISAIPPGPGGKLVYDIELLDHSPSFPYEHYWVKDVDGRRYIKIHRGNFYHQIEGCILIGKEHREIDGDGIMDVTNSTQALKELIALVGKEGKLEINYPVSDLSLDNEL